MISRYVLRVQRKLQTLMPETQGFKPHYLHASFPPQVNNGLKAGTDVVLRIDVPQLTT